MLNLPKKDQFHPWLRAKTIESQINTIEWKKKILISGKRARQIEGENWKVTYVDGICLLKDYERYEAKKRHNTPKGKADAKQLVQKLTKMWQKIDPTMSLTENTFRNADNLEEKYVSHYITFSRKTIK